MRKFLFAVAVAGVLAAGAAVAADHPTSIAPADARGGTDASTWAMLIMGFGVGGATVRRRQKRYRLVERLADGDTRAEEFVAPSDELAVRRARQAVGDVPVQVWRGSTRLA